MVKPGMLYNALSGVDSMAVWVVDSSWRLTDIGSTNSSDYACLCGHAQGLMHPGPCLEEQSR